MSWVPNRTFARGAIAAILLAGAASAAANVLVVRSSGPSAGNYPPGKSLADNARIALQRGDTLIVLAGGATRTFRGPGTFTATGPVRSGTGLAAAAGNRRARTGAVRNAGIVPRSPTIWHVDVSQSGKVCVADAGNVMLWRPDAAETVTLTVAPASGAAQTVEWPAGQATLAWPAGVAFAEGAEYRVSWTGNDDPARITFAALDPVPTDLTQVAEALIANECQGQLDLLVETAPTAQSGN